MYTKLLTSNYIQLSASGSSGNYTASFDVVYHTWNISSFTCTASIVGSTYSGTANVNVSIGTTATYNSQFFVTGYYVVNESSCIGNPIAVNGVSGYFRSDFIEAVQRNGSGVTLSGQLLWYNSQTGHFQFVTRLWTASGTEPEVGRTIAVDWYYIPRYHAPNNEFHRAKVYITSVGFRQAEDAGGDILAYKIDVYVGIGGPLTSASWDSTWQYVTYLGNDLY